MKITTPNVLFFSDLHLDPFAQDITVSFCNFISYLEKNAQIQDSTIFILGDLFETWIGDDVLHRTQSQTSNNTFLSVILQQLQILSSQAPTYFIHGNRDFLISHFFEERTGIQCLKEIELIHFHNLKLLLCHGDHLCTQDTHYISFRNQVRQPQWQQWFMGHSLEKRQSIADTIRAQSALENTTKSMDILDITPASAEDMITQYQPDAVIHGHTHRPAIHHTTIPRIVLGDWDPRPSWLSIEANNAIITGSLHARDWKQRVTLTSSAL